VRDWTITTRHVTLIFMSINYAWLADMHFNVLYCNRPSACSSKIHWCVSRHRNSTRS